MPYEQVDIFQRGNRKPPFLAKNPLGGIPVLELDDGTCIASRSRSAATSRRCIRSRRSSARARVSRPSSRCGTAASSSIYSTRSAWCGSTATR
ncbi:MAG: hypothetical protein AB7V27_17130 [Candidatus Binatia bacterium]